MVLSEADFRKLADEFGLSIEKGLFKHNHILYAQIGNPSFGNPITLFWQDESDLLLYTKISKSDAIFSRSARLAKNIDDIRKTVPKLLESYRILKKQIRIERIAEL